MELDRVNQILDEHEETFVFPSFGSADVLKLGLCAVEAAKRRSAHVGISIRNLAGDILFQYMINGTRSTTIWLDRKHRTVCTVGKSTLWLYAWQAAQKTKDTVQPWSIEPGKYAVCGGGFPIRLKDTGLIGSFCVSGLDHESDHDLIIDALCDYFGGKQVPRISPGSIPEPLHFGS